MANKCPACGAYVDGDVCDWRCADEMDRRVKWEGREPCDDCLAEKAGWEIEPATEGTLCVYHAELRAEAQS